MAEAGDRRVPLGLLRAAVADEFWLGEPARALLAVRSEEAVGALLESLLELVGAFEAGADDLLVAPSLSPEAVARASPAGFLALLHTPLFEALTATMEMHRRHRALGSG